LGLGLSWPGAAVEQQRRVGVTLEHGDGPRFDLVGHVRADWYESFAGHLVVEVAQVWGVLAVGDDAVQGQQSGVFLSEPGLHEQRDQQLAAFVVDPREVRGLLQLSHDELGQRPGGQRGLAGNVLGVERNAGIEVRDPVVLADSGQEYPNRGQRHAAAVGHESDIDKQAKQSVDACAGELADRGVRAGDVGEGLGQPG
jgi:hypothetical protein